MSSLSEDGDRVVAALTRLQRTEALDRLQPGLDRQRVRQVLIEAGCAAPDGLVELYAWRDGTRVETGTRLDDVHLFPGFWFLSLEDAVVEWQALREHERWDPQWFPVFANGGGDFYAVLSDQSQCPVLGFLIDVDEHEVEYDSLAAMMWSLAESYERGIFFVDDDGALDMDDEQHAAVAGEARSD